MTSPDKNSQYEAPARAAIHAPIFSEPEVVNAVVIPDVYAAKAAVVFSDPF